MEEHNYTVYMHKNKINGKVYIGITRQKPVKRRWKQGSCYKCCKKFYRAIQKYGWNNFEHIILFENLTCNDACKKEIELIKKYNSIKNGYNISKGGKATNNKIHFTKEHKKKIGFANKGYKNGMYGKTHTDEVKNIISKKSKKQWLNEEYKQKMKHIVKYEKNRFTKVICLETNEIFFSIAEASRKYNLHSQNISKCCRGLRNKCGNLHWRYYEK
jgi:group I intron endonuclease